MFLLLQPIDPLPKEFDLCRALFRLQEHARRNQLTSVLQFTCIAEFAIATLSPQ